MVILITNPTNIFYLTGLPLHQATPGREVFLVLAKKENLVITDGRLSQLVKEKLTNKFTVVERTYQKPVTKILADFLKKHHEQKLGFEAANLTFAEWQKLKKALKGIKLVPTLNLIENKRVIKTKEELRKISKAAYFTDKTFSLVLPYLKAGVSEKEIVWKIKTILRDLGAETAFEPIVASGPGSAIPHYIATPKKIRPNEMILLDFGAKYQGYCSDMTRMVFLGQPNNKAQKLYQLVWQAQQKAIKTKTTLARKIDQAARDFLCQNKLTSIPHGVGHGVGLSIHELPRLNPKSQDQLKNGMVFTIEPGVYLPGFGGIRIEDLVVFEKNHFKILSKTTKKIIRL